MTRTLMLSVVLLVAGIALPANAQTCSSFLSSHISWAQGSGQGVFVSVVSQQENDLASYSGRWSTPYHFYQPVLRWDGTYLTTTASLGYAGRWLFSDRYSSGQPFYASSWDSIDVWVNSSGQTWIRDNAWGSWHYIGSPTCANGILYGWGTPIGSGASTAMFILTFKDGIIVS